MNKVLLAAVLASLTPAAVLAADPMPHHARGDMLSQWDTNADGTVTRDEAQAAASARAAEHFDRLDQNGDGVLTQEELDQMRTERHAAMQEQAKERFQAADANGDGALSRDEVKDNPMLTRGFDRIDVNKDGLISQEELQAQRGKMRRR